MRASFAGAHAEKADFRGADLTDADLSEANFERAELEGAKLDAVVTERTNFHKARGLDAPRPPRGPYR